MAPKLQTAYLAGGCFWGLEELFRTELGVVDTEVGYAGGENDNPTYEHHPGHDRDRIQFAMLPEQQRAANAAKSPLGDVGSGIPGQRFRTVNGNVGVL